MVSFTGVSLFILSSSSLAIWLSLARTVLVEFSGSVKDEFEHFLMMKVAPAPICHSISELNHEKNIPDFCAEHESVHVTFFYLQSGCKT